MNPRIRLTLLVLVAALAAASPALAADALVVERSDGQIDPLASSLRARSLSFVKEAGIPLSTRLRVGYDDDGLWVSFECEDTRLTADVTEAGAALDGEDQVRVTLASPDGTRVSVTLSALDQLRGQRNGGATLSEDELGSLQHAAIVLGDGAMFVPGKPNQERLEAWVGSVHLPWSLFGASGHGDGWSANFERSDYDSGDQAMWQWAEAVGPLSFK